MKQGAQVGREGGVSSGVGGSVREMFRLFWVTADGYVKSRICLALGLVIASSVLMALVPLALKYIVDGLSRGPRIDPAPVLMLIGFYIAAQWLARAAGEIRALVHGQADRRLYSALTSRLFSHVMHLPLRFHLERQTGAVNEALSNGLLGFQMVLQTSIYTLLPVLIQLGTVTLVLLKLDQPVFLAAFVVALLCYAAVFGYGTVRTARAARGASSAQVDARAVMTDSILNYETVKYFTAERMVRARLDQSLNQTEIGWLRFYRSRSVTGVLVATVFAAFLAATVFYAASQVLGGRMTVGDFVLVNMYMIQLAGPLEQVGSAVQSLSQGAAYLDKMLHLFRQEQEPGSSGDGQGLPGGTNPGELIFQNVGVAYRADRAVLKDVSFRLPAGKTLGIVGASGTGKSTIVRLLVRLMDPDSGSISLGGVPLRELSVASLRRSIAVVPQDTVLFNESIGYNIGFGRLDVSSDDVERAAQVARLHDFIMKLPEGYDTRVGERGAKLSGGERQRVSIARAALKSPSIYVFDEATSALDSQTEQEILGNLRELSRYATTLIIAHRLSTVVHADEIVVLKEGVVAERGRHEELLALDGIYATLWSAQRARSDKPHAAVMV